ncbi:SGNH/GDSL hydrolase family protein [Streptomyces tanashiensis]|uniref:GDSL-type esterase/lipase family protein n=1 Tax=Streptomyces tanashiensis TaxID=67367 RepID=A0ABY6R2B1_9ACTN|nr:SGNH/GDSL hydrolase family protein [Streptomyces tanashiensis]UZX24155.1 GDSL-type esterase/lipase family protein [Streptomyces tanashiensis]GGY21423.1 lipoprotein [Streptomyces tanashiensis]
MRGRRRFRTALAAATAALLCGGVLSGCTAGDPEAAAPSARPTVRPTPSPTPLWDVSPASVAAVGDSVTRAFDACSVLTDCPEVSWATGTDTAVNSLALRLLGPEKVATRSWNLARTGARMAELPEQMAGAAAEKPELVTVMMGANDACRATPDLMTPVAGFRASFETALARLRAGAPKAQVYVASVPDLKHLWSTGRVSPMGLQVWKLGICGAMLADAEDLGPAAERRRAAVRDRVVAYNEVLEEVCAKDARCRYDGGAVFGFRFDGGQLSPWDWFHPSKDGQARLAELAYRRITKE